MVEAEDGNTAVSIFAATPPDAVVLDALMLPGRSGFLVLEKIREATVAPRGDGDREPGTSTSRIRPGLGVSAYLVKPVSLTRLMDVLGDLLSSPNA